MLSRFKSQCNLIHNYKLINNYNLVKNRNLSRGYCNSFIKWTNKVVPGTNQNETKRLALNVGFNLSGLTFVLTCTTGLMPHLYEVHTISPYVYDASLVLTALASIHLVSDARKYMKAYRESDLIWKTEWEMFSSIILGILIGLIVGATFVLFFNYVVLRIIDRVKSAYDRRKKLTSIANE